MAAPLKISFATDISSAKQGMQDLAASVVSNMVKVGGAMTAVANDAGGYATAVGKAASSVAGDLNSIVDAGVQASRQTGAAMSSVAAAVGKAAADTKTAAVAMDAAKMTASASAAFTFQTLRKEAAATANVLLSSPAFMGGAAIAAGVAGLVVSFEALSKAVQTARDHLEEYAKIADRAKDLNVGTTFLQNFTDETKNARVEVKELQDALDHARASLKPGVDDQSAARKQLGNLFETGYLGDYKSAGLKIFDTSSDDEGKIRGVLTAMQELRDLGNEVAGLDLAEKVFGPKFADSIRAGRIELDGLVNRLDDAKIPDETIQRAADLRDRLHEAWQEIEDNLKVSMINLEPVANGILAVWVKIVQTIAAATKALNDFSTASPSAPFNQNPFTVDFKRAAEVAQKFWSMGTPVSSPDSPNNPGAPGARAITVPNWNDPTTYPPAARTQIDPPWDQPGYVSGDERRKPPAPAPTDPNAGAGLPPRRPLSLFTGSGHDSGSGSGDDTEQLDAIERYVKSLEKANETAKAELETQGKGNVEREKAVALAKLYAAAREAGRQPTEEEIANTERLAESTAKEKDALKDLQQQAKQTKEAITAFGQEGVNALSDLIFEGKSFDEVMQNLAKTLGKQALQAALMGSGPLAGLFGTAAPASAGANASGGIIGMLMSTFGGAHANGGDIPAGTWGLVGEKGPELIGPSNGRRTVIPNHALRAPAIAAAMQAPSVPSAATMGGTSSPIAIHNHAGVPVQTRQTGGPQGIRTEIMIGDQFAKYLRSPEAAPVLRELGVKRMARGRG